ncbi:MAG: hypothetical protein GF409_04850 [Candidatus Omnitrophica bacterium]|nr:hypothetical protein [Candidatus Omnitrophota bacterium]
MNFLLEFTKSNYKVWHSVAKRLNKIYPGSSFSGLCGKDVVAFLEGQDDLEYRTLYVHPDIVKESLKDEVDHVLLEDFEKQLPRKSLWRLISSDREWGSPFMHGAVLNKTFINMNNDRENILKLISGSIKRYRKIFDEQQVDIFLPAIAMGSVSVHLLEHICRERNIPYIVPTSVRVKSFFTFAGDVQLRFPQIDRTYERISRGELEVDLDRAERLYRELISEFKDSQYFDRQLPCFNQKKLDSVSAHFIFWLKTVKAVIVTMWRWLGDAFMDKTRLDIYRQLHTPGVLVDNVKNILLRQKMRAYLLGPGYGEELPPGQKYIYYPLHTSPEYSTQFQGTMWMDQLYTIELLAKSVPFDWVVYVKEHPAILTSRVRPKGFYERLERLPNVKLAPIYADTHNLIGEAEIVSVVTGTTGWEAVQRGKPLITFADNFWDVLALSRKCTDVESLSRDIQDEVERMKVITENERKSRIVRFLAAVLEHGFEITYPQQFSYEKGSDEQYATVGRETADALKRHLDQVHKKDFYEECI